ncbi:I78 family peptidase inhibitor [Tropicimonas sp.]|uniref:I78 family peptidase inhibitor n=1 Tax=Tropicimonas sp. TaxID=2067044 RepID=UPI003A8A62B4
MKSRIAVTAVLLAALAACEPAITSDPVTGSIVTEQPPTTTMTTPEVQTAPLDQTTPTGPVEDPALSMVEESPSPGGLLEREPDTCKVGDFVYLRGQTSTEVQGAGITRPYRVIGPSDIVTQEYNPMRVNFYTDGSGRIGRVSCG